MAKTNNSFKSGCCLKINIRSVSIGLLEKEEDKASGKFENGYRKFHYEERNGIKKKSQNVLLRCKHCNDAINSNVMMNLLF